MRSRAPLAVVALLLLTIALFPSGAEASSSYANTLLGLGYGPLSVQPASTAVPVFAPGDSLWVQSYSNSSTITLILASPNGSVFPSVELPPDGLVKVYSFPPSGPVGEWTLDAYIGGGLTQVSFSVASATPVPPPTLESVGLSKGNLVLDYSIANTTAYGIQACLMGPGSGGTTTLQLPPSLASYMTVSLNGSSISAFAPQAEQPFSAWFQLYTPRTYFTSGGLVTYDTMAGQSQVLTLGASTEPTTAQLDTFLSLRNGSYDLRSYVRTPAGISSYDTSYVLVNGSAWVSLGACVQTTQVTSSSFQLSAPLNGTASSWPTSLITTYIDNGIGGFTFSKAPAPETRISLGNATQAVGLGMVKVTASGGGVVGSDVYGGNLYVVVRSYPALASVALNFENVTTVTFPVTILGPYRTESIQPSVGTVDASAVDAGAPVGNATLLVESVGSQPARLKSGEGGSVSVALPPGEYNFSMRFGGVTVSQLVQAYSGEATQVTLNAATPRFPVLLVALGAVLALGVAIDVVVWRAYILRRRALR